VSRIDSIVGRPSPLRAEAVLLCDSFRIEGDHLVITSPFVSERAGRLRPVIYGLELRG
jgi:hypothetical protein